MKLLLAYATIPYFTCIVKCVVIYLFGVDRLNYQGELGGF